MSMNWCTGKEQWNRAILFVEPRSIVVVEFHIDHPLLFCAFDAADVSNQYLPRFCSSRQDAANFTSSSVPSEEPLVSPRLLLPCSS